MQDVFSGVGQIFSVEGLDVDIQTMMKKLNDLEKVEDGGIVKQIMLEAGEILAQEQKRIVGQKYPQFANYISVSVKKNKKNGWSVWVGYKSDVIKDHIEVLIIEFGRPGARGIKKGKIDTKGRKIGVIQPHSHIRAAMFNKKDYLINYVSRRFFEEIQRRWGAM